MTTNPTNTRVVLASRPDGEPTPDNFRVEPAPVPEPVDGEVLVRTIYLSLDPYMRGRISTNVLYAATVEVDDVILGGTVSEVVTSRSDDFAPGDFVLGMGGWQAYAVLPAAQLTKLDPAHAPISTAVGVLGVPGFTGYGGLLEIGDPQPGETVVVAAASGPVGSMVGHVAKARGARAVGIAGGPAKVAYLTEIGFDVALDHRSPTFADDLKAAVPDGIDVYFENVGGHVWDAVWPLLNPFARVPVSGLVAHYNEDESPVGIDRSGQMMRALQMRRWTVRGFIQTDFYDTQWENFQREVSEWIRTGTLDYREDVTEGLENAPEAFIGLLKGKNFGKVLIRVAPDPTR